MSAVDACACGNTELPSGIETADRGRILSYLCADCGRGWTLTIEKGAS